MGKVTKILLQSKVLCLWFDRRNLCFKEEAVERFRKSEVLSTSNMDVSFEPQHRVSPYHSCVLEKEPFDVHSVMSVFDGHIYIYVYIYL